MSARPTYEDLEQKIRHLEQEKAEYLGGQKEEELKQDHFRLQEAITSGKVGLWDWDLKTNEVSFSSEWKRQIGYEDHEIDNDYTEWESRVHPEDLQETLKNVTTSINQANDYHENVFRFRHKDGSYRWILAHASVAKDESGQPVRMIGSHVDITDEKHKEELLLRSKQLLNTTGLMAKVGGWELDIDAQEVSWTEETCRIHELPLDHQPILDEAIHFFAPEDRPKLKSAIQRAINDAEPYDLEVRFTTAEGRQLWVRTICQPEVVNGKTTKLVGALQDITEQKMSEIALQDSEERFRLAERQNRYLLDYSPVCHKIIDLDCKLRYMNANGYRMLKLNPNDNIYGTSYPFAFFPESHFTELTDALRKVIETGETAHVEGKTRDFEGNEAWLSHNLIPVPADDGAIDFITVVSADVTKRKESEVALQDSEERFRRLAENSVDMIYRMSLPGGTYEYVSPASESIFGYTPEEFYSSPAMIKERIHPDWMDYFASEWEKLAAGEMSPFYEYQIIHKSGETRWLNQRNVLVKDENGDPMAIEGIVTDVTEQKNVEQQIRQKYKMEAVGVMAAGMAHNFNNNLSIILGNLELSKLKLSSENEVSDFLDYAKIAVIRSRDLVKQIMSYSRKERPVHTPMQLSLLLKETVSLLKSTIPSSIKLSAEISPEGQKASIHGDSSQIQECLLNLCNNAVHAMEEKGGLLLKLEQVELKEKDISKHYDCSPGKYLRLSVQDSGCGIPAENMGKIFDPFFTTKELHEGTGMGLSSVHGIVKKHGGMVSVDSRVGIGTTLHLSFPTVNQLKKEQEQNKDIKWHEGTEKILYVDDDEMIAELNGRMLSKMGYHATIITDSVEALKHFSANVDSYDLVMTDQTMPELTGTELIQKIKQLRPELPTILCTGYSNKVNEEGARQAGISAFLMKPTDFTEMSQVIREVLEKPLAI